MRINLLLFIQRVENNVITPRIYKTLKMMDWICIFATTNAHLSIAFYFEWSNQFISLALSILFYFTKGATRTVYMNAGLASWLYFSLHPVLAGVTFVKCLGANVSEVASVLENFKVWEHF